MGASVALLAAFRCASTAVCLASRCIAHRFTDKRADKHRRHEPTHETR